MLKVTIKGEVYPFDNDSYPLAEAIELEEKLGMTFAEWNLNFYRGSAKAKGGLAWLVLKRDGQNVPCEDILSGKWPDGGLGIDDILVEMEGEPDPTEAPSAPDGGNTSEPSVKSSGSPRPRSTRSPSPSSTTTSDTS
jgi:hypothetical protein